MRDLPLKLLLVDDHEVVRRGMAALIESHRDWRIVGEAGDGRRAVQLAEEHQPDVVVMDIGMPELNGFEAARQILKAVLGVEILILSMHESEELVREVIDAGARGYVLKSDAGRHLVAAVESLARGQPFFTSQLAARVYEETRHRVRRGRPPVIGLTRREREVLQLLGEGRHNREVAARLEISIKTVETHRARIMRKLDVRTVAELVLYAVRANIIQP
ncbi:MAG: hypothetical protein QOE70_174 [Chthoniobacter sp.]|jgi:DNA-binding NarL/FixJ family response regulator|nr:hypothetical protein [Chthoniobacter sp.]